MKFNICTSSVKNKEQSQAFIANVIVIVSNNIKFIFVLIM
jgi:hypothetical protein